MNTNLNSSSCTTRLATITFAALIAATATTSRAGTAIDLISGFDAARLENAYPITNTTAAAEVAKVLYRIDKLKPDSLRKRIDANSGESESPAGLGDAVEVSGIVVSAKAYAVPAELVDLLDFSLIARITLDVSIPNSGPDDRAYALILSTDANANLQPGDRVSALGVQIAGVSDLELPLSASDAGDDDSSIRYAVVCASQPIAWFPATAKHVGWKLLSQYDFDLRQIDRLAGLNRQPLSTDDVDAFYDMTRVADEIGRRSNAATWPTPKPVNPVSLLRKPTELIGHWVTLKAETVRITRVAVTKPERQQQIGGDHYFQIDAIGDLGDVKVQVSRFAGDEDPVEFQNRYPVSIIAKRLPDFLAAKATDQFDQSKVVALVNHPIRFEGFFYRIWSYQNDLMNRQQGGDQFGPLMIAARLTDAKIDSASDPVGVSAIGYIAAGLTLVAVIAASAWSIRTSRQDKLAKQKRHPDTTIDIR